MANMIPFYFDNYAVRVELDEQGDPWWIAQDVCQVLALKNVSNAVGRLLPGEKSIRQADKQLIINESGLYRLIFRSDKKEARRFQTWVFDDVLPQIRKTGKYEPPPSAVDRFPELRAIVELAESTAEARLLAENAQLVARAAEQRSFDAEARASQADAKADRAMETQSFFTVAEYVTFQHLERQLTPRDYRPLSEHLQAYCMGKGIPFRRIHVGGKPWNDEYGYHVNIYAEVLPGWLQRRFAQETLTVVRPATEVSP